MSAAWQLYFITLLVYTGTDAIAVWGLNLQFGQAGILNFAFIIFQSAGAYVASVLTLGPSTSGGGFQHYILGTNLPWPVPIVVAGLAAGALAAVVGQIALRPTRIDFQGMVLLTVAIIVTVVVTDYPGLFNGDAGLAGVPKPMQVGLNLGDVSYGWLYVGLTAAIAALTYSFVRRLTRSPWGRQLRAIRENPSSARSVGLNIDGRRLQAFVLGGAIAGVSGAILVQFVGAWAPASWGYGETFFFFTALIIGGVGTNSGSLLGAVLVFGVIINGIQFLPNFSYTNVTVALQSIALGVAFIAFIWLKPGGLLPEHPEPFRALEADSAVQIESSRVPEGASR